MKVFPSLFPEETIHVNKCQKFDCRGWDDLREQHRNMYIIKCETDRQSRLDAWDKCSGLVHWDDPEGWDEEGGGRGIQDGEHM